MQLDYSACIELTAALPETTSLIVAATRQRRKEEGIGDYRRYIPILPKVTPVAPKACKRRLKIVEQHRRRKVSFRPGREKLCALLAL